ncbi:MAG: NADH-quinone oxidoreductase subunit C [Crocinitomicaceae bacterium]|nr:NADH-quinone oxidoreductase subunit C [Crocinitomicaceae bacterium]
MSELLEKVKIRIESEFGQDIKSSQMDYDFPVFVVEKSIVVKVLEFLKNDPELGFSFLTTMCGIHFPENTGSEFAMMYQLHNLEKNWRIRVKIFMSEKEMDVPSITHLWASANWQERQEYDFFGFRFKGHPDLRRILNMDEMNYFPMRKEYALEDAGREDKQDKYFGR